MVWQVDRAERRTFDPDSELEIVSARTGREETITSFRIEGPGRELRFSASMSEARATADELQQLGLSEAGAWTVITYPQDDDPSR